MSRRRLSEPSFAFLLNAPALLAIVGLVGYPIAYSLWLSLHRYNLKRPNLFRFVGVGNYVEIFGSDEFWAALQVTLLFTALGVTLVVALAVLIALLLNEPFPGRGFVRTMVLVPWAIPPVVNGLMWQWIYDAKVGALNGLLVALRVLPAYRGYLYDRKAAQKAGVDKPPVTLEALKQAALAVKKGGMAEYPILKGFKTNVDGLDEFWSMVFASGGNLFDEELSPVYPDKDKTGLTVLEWMVQAMHDWKILDPKGLELDETQARDAFVNGQGFFTSNVGNVLPRANNPKLSKRAGDISPTRFPGLTDAGKGPMGWTRLYCIDAKTKVKDAAWQLIAYMGGKDKTGVYYTAKDWYTKYGVGYPFMSLDKDPDMIKVHKEAGWDLEVRSQQYASARARTNIKAPWYNEWDRFTQQQIQNALLKKASPRDALAASAKKAVDLKKQWS